MNRKITLKRVRELTDELIRLDKSSDAIALHIEALDMAYEIEVGHDKEGKLSGALAVSIVRIESIIRAKIEQENFMPEGLLL
ncbi:MAG: hypothetical protein Q9M22_07705 [Mariprofundaceae bacterium]|nr:hypothetical protein [Mariprofundaceae bacterium]